MTVRACLWSAILSHHTGARVGRPQCRLRPTVLVRPRRMPPVCHRPEGDSLTTRRAAGQGRQQCRPRANCDGCAYPRPRDRILPVYHRSMGAGCPQCRPRANCDGYPYLRTVANSLSLPGRRAGHPQWQGAHSVGQGLTVTAAPTSAPWLTLSSAGRGAGRPQCRPRANCDGCNYMLTLSSLGRGVGRPHCRPRANCAQLRPAHPHTHAASAPRRQWAGRSVGLPEVKAGATPTWTRAPGAEY